MEIGRREFRRRHTKNTGEARARKRKNAAKKKTNLNKKKGKRQEKGGNPNAIKSPTMARPRKKFSPCQRAPRGASADEGGEGAREEGQDAGR